MRMKMTMGLVACLTLAGISAATSPTPTEKASTVDYSTFSDPLQRCAAKAVSGVFHQVPRWKLNIYQSVLERNITVQGKAKRTSYCPDCSGTNCADGSPVRRGVCAAPKNIPMHSIIWIETDGLVKVCDRGGWVKAWPWWGLKKGEDIVVDVWLPDCIGDCWSGPGTHRFVPYAVIR